MARKSIKVGIMPLRDIKARAIAIARGKSRVVPAPEPELMAGQLAPNRVLSVMRESAMHDVPMEVAL